MGNPSSEIFERLAHSLGEIEELKKQIESGNQQVVDNLQSIVEEIESLKWKMNVEIKERR